MHYLEDIINVILKCSLEILKDEKLHFKNYPVWKRVHVIQKNVVRDAPLEFGSARIWKCAVLFRYTSECL